MAGYFLDTSALGKHYHPEAGTPDVDGIFQTQGAQLLISRLAVVEIHSAFARKVRTHEITDADFRLLISLFRADVAQKVVKVARMKFGHFQEAARLIEKHAMTKSLRTLDSIQLAVALDLHRRGRLDHFVSADKDICAIAQIEGLAVINPAP
ncbi:MAG: type II toxin-antitoxin system VapC family toxin [Blastocatellia bacterium]